MIMSDVQSSSLISRKVLLAAVGAAAVGTLGYIVYRKLKNDSTLAVSGSVPKPAPKVAVVQPNVSDESLQAAQKKTELTTANDYKLRGNELFKSNEYAQAIDCYTKALALITSRDAASASTYYQNRAAAYDKLNKPEKVVEDCTSAIQFNRSYTKAFKRRAHAYETMGRLDETLTDLMAAGILESFAGPDTATEIDRVIKVISESKAKEMLKSRGPDGGVPLSVTFIESYLNSFCEDPVLNSLDSIHSGNNEDDTEQPLSGFDSAKLCLIEKRYSDVQKACATEIDIDGPNAMEALLLRATMALIEGKSQLATEDFLEFFARFDSLDEERQKANTKLKVNGYIKRGSFHMQQGRKDEAMSDFEKAEQADPDNADIYHHRGQLYIILSDIEKAKADFDRCVALRPDFAVARVQSAYANYRQASLGTSSECQKSIESFVETVEQFPDCAEGYALLGQVYAEREMYEESCGMFDKALELQPLNANVYVHKGLLELQKTEDMDAAISVMLTATQVDPHCEFAYESIGTIELQRGKINEAVEYFDRALHLVRTETELAAIYQTKEVSLAQLRAAELLGIELPPP